MTEDSKRNVGVVLVAIVLALVLGAWRLYPVWRAGGDGFLRFSGSGQTVIGTGAKYAVVEEKPTGWFSIGQKADIVLSAMGFNDAGGPLLFNHPGGITSDGQRLILADRNNNRVLIWNKAPRGNELPDLVLGQKDFNSIAPGVGMDELNWPVCVATDGTRLIVCDTQNHRVLVWRQFPAQNGQPADMVFGGYGDDAADRRGRIVWPWAAWTNGEKMVITSTMGSQVLIWNSFPVASQAPAEIVIRLPQLGTPRSIGSDGRRLVISDHNAKVDGGNTQGTFFWSEWPQRENEPYDFFMAMPSGGAPLANKNLSQGEVLWGMNFLPDGRFIGLGSRLFVWDDWPKSSSDQAAWAIGASSFGDGGYKFQGGDGSGSAVVDNRLYLSLANGNKVVGFNKIPAKSLDEPDFVIGSPKVEINTLDTEFIISNPVPATDGDSLFVLSDFDGRLYVWRNLPNESGAHPDYVYHGMSGDDIALFGNKLVIAGQQKVTLWNSLPKDGEKPDKVFSGAVGDVRFQDLRGVAIDERYFYLADQEANVIYVWEGVPDGDNKPIAKLSVNRPLKISSDGEYLTAACCQDQPGGGVVIWRVADIAEQGSEAKPQYLKFASLRLNLPGAVVAKDGALFIADSGGNRVLVWRDVAKALAGAKPEVVLGQNNLQETWRRIGQSTMFMPNALAFDGTFLWVGEVKFSERLLRFSVR